MFGHTEDTTQQDDQQQVVSPVTDGFTGDASASADAASDDFMGGDVNTSAPLLPAVASDDDDTDKAVSAAEPEEKVTEEEASAEAPAIVLADKDGLLDIKQEALAKLTPLVDHLDQSPEEKFRTTMMMIQAADNDSLVKKAYETALKIEDEKVRAQALLDVINEINYFTQHDA